MHGKLTYWETPDSYFGFDPVGDVLVLSCSRDSDALSRTNWNAAVERMLEVARQECLESDRSRTVYAWEASHWMVGWIRYLMVRADAPEAVIVAAQHIANDLDAYPALDEAAWSELEYEEACDLWEGLGVEGRLDMIRWARAAGDDVSPFAARRTNIPSDLIEEHLRAA